MTPERKAQLAAIQKQLIDLQAEAEGFSEELKKEQEAAFRAFTGNGEAIKGLYASANAENKMDTRLSGSVPGVDGTVTITVRFGSILKRVRKDSAKVDEAEKAAPAVSAAPAAPGK